VFPPWFLTNDGFNRQVARRQLVHNRLPLRRKHPIAKDRSRTALTLIASCLINVFYTAVTRVVGRGVKLEGVKTESPLTTATMTVGRTRPRPFAIISGDTVLEVDGQKVRTVEQIAALINASSSTKLATVIIYRGDQVPTSAGVAWTSVAGRDKPRNNSHRRRTYWQRLARERFLWTLRYLCRGVAADRIAGTWAVHLPADEAQLGRYSVGVGLSGYCLRVVAYGDACFVLAFLVSATAMFLLATSRRTILIAFACVVPLVIAGALLLQQSVMWV